MRIPLICALAFTCAVPASAAEKKKVDPYAAIVDATDRSDEDRKDDEARKPVDVLRFIEVKPGMKVADVGAGGGYTTELLARAVGEKGVVYSHNNKLFTEKFVGTKLDERLAKPANKNVVKVIQEFDDPLPPEAKNLDIVINAFTYHDTVWVGTDRDKMNQAIFAALKPGGIYVVLDHADKPGGGTADTKTLHRIEQKSVVDEVKKAGFQLARTGDFMKNPADPHDKIVFDPSIRGKTDRFALAFVKPAK